MTKHRAARRPSYRASYRTTGPHAIVTAIYLKVLNRTEETIDLLASNICVVYHITQEIRNKHTLLCSRPIDWGHNAMMAIVSMSVCLSVCPVTVPKSRTELHMKLKFGSKEAYDRCHHDFIYRSKGQSQRSSSLGLRNSKFWHQLLPPMNRDKMINITFYEKFC